MELCRSAQLEGVGHRGLYLQQLTCKKHFLLSLVVRNS